MRGRAEFDGVMGRGILSRQHMGIGCGVPSSYEERRLDLAAWREVR